MLVVPHAMPRLGRLTARGFDELPICKMSKDLPPVPTDMFLDWLWGSLIQHLMGLWLLAEILWPFIIIGPIVRGLLERQISQDTFDRKRFNGFVQILTPLLYVTLEIEFLDISMTASCLMHWIAIGVVFIIVWRYPEQIPNLSVFPEGLVQPYVVKIKRHLPSLGWVAKMRQHLPSSGWPWKPKSFPVQLVRGDQLKSPSARQRVGILGDVFHCFICRKQKGYPEEYGATLFIKRKRSHVCAECVQAAPQLKVADLRRWL